MRAGGHGASPSRRRSTSTLVALCRQSLKIVEYIHHRCPTSWSYTPSLVAARDGVFGKSAKADGPTILIGGVILLSLVLVGPPALADRLPQHSLLEGFELLS